MPVEIRPLRESDAAEWHHHLVTHRRALQPWEPLRGDAWYAYEAVLDRLREGEHLHNIEVAFAFAVVVDGAIVGRVGLTNVLRGVAHSADLGYHVAPTHWGRGVATAAVSAAVATAFDDLRLHRVQAGVMPRNVASLRVLDKIGFRREGLAERYLRIGGRWEDHILLARTLEEHIRCVAGTP